jgi:hypothetical protein
MLRVADRAPLRVLGEIDVFDAGVRMTHVQPYPDWLDFHSRTVGGPVAGIRARAGIVRLELGEGEIADRVEVGIPDDDAWSTFARTLEEAGFWDWPDDTTHREPHRPGDWYWWLEVREPGREHRAAAWNQAPDGLEQVRRGLFELVEQVIVEAPP